MQGAAEACVDRYIQLTKVDRASLKKVSTPCIDDHLLAPEDFVTKGVCSPVAPNYFIRLVRPDVYWTVNDLARNVTKWNVACDKRLHRLMCYIHHTKNYAMRSFVGDEPKDCKLLLFADASFAGCLSTSKSTSGGVLCLVGPNTFTPISWLCKKQGAVSHSSTEAEIIALDACLRMEALPAQGLWDLVIDVFHPDPTKPSPLPRLDNHRMSPPTHRPTTPPSTLSPEYDGLTNVDYLPTCHHLAIRSYSY